MERRLTRLTRSGGYLWTFLVVDFAWRIIVSIIGFGLMWSGSGYFTVRTAIGVLLVHEAWRD